MKLSLKRILKEDVQSIENDFLDFQKASKTIKNHFPFLEKKREEAIKIFSQQPSIDFKNWDYQQFGKKIKESDKWDPDLLENLINFFVYFTINNDEKYQTLRREYNESSSRDFYTAVNYHAHTEIPRESDRFLREMRIREEEIERKIIQEIKPRFDEYVMAVEKLDHLSYKNPDNGYGPGLLGVIRSYMYDHPNPQSFNAIEDMVWSALGGARALDTADDNSAADELHDVLADFG